MLTQEKIEEIKMQLIGLEPEKQQQKLKEILSTLSEEEREQLVGKQQCPFCLMVEGKIQVKTVYEDEKVLAILDINPITYGHILVLPKKHYSNLSLMKDEDIGYLFEIVNKLKFQIIKLVNANGSNVFLAEGVVAGQNADHVFVNVIPRFDNDNVEFNFKRKNLSEEELEKLRKLFSDIHIEKIESKNDEISKIYRNLISRIP